MSRIENPDIKKYLEKYVKKKLSECDLFVDTFGKGFISRRLSLNLDKVYTNEINKTCLGYRSSNDLSITICKSGPDGKLLTPEDLTEDDRETILHESVHAILSKTITECNKYELYYGTGMLAKYSNGVELGRGLNEGLTEWICGKAGFKTKSYVILTNFIKQIELAVGAENVMKFGKGDVHKNIAPILGMELEETYQYMGIADALYNAETNIRDINIVTDILEKKKNIEKLSEEEKKVLEEDVASLPNEKWYKNLSNNQEYFQMLSDNGLEDNDDNRLEFLKNIRERYVKEAVSSRVEFESITFDKYFSKEFEDLKQMENVPDELFDKFYSLEQLTINSSKHTEGLEENSVLKFRKEFKVIKEKYKETLNARLAADIASDSLTIGKFEEYKKLYEKVSFGYATIDIVSTEIAKIMGYENPQVIVRLISRLASDGKIEEANKYHITELATSDGNEKSYIYSKDGVAQFSDYSYGRASFESQEQVDTDGLFDFTLVEDEDFSKIIRDFIDLKSEIESKDPHARITILSREIIINSNGETSYYKIVNGEFLPLEEKENYQVNIFSEEKNNDITLPVKKQKDSFIKKAFLNLKRKLFANREENVVYGLPKSQKTVDDSEEKDSASSAKPTFDEYIQVSNFNEKYKRSQEAKREASYREKLNDNDDITK